MSIGAVSVRGVGTPANHPYQRGRDVAGISLSKIEKSFGETRVLNGIDIDVTDGEFLTLVGPSGCGKSTLLRIIAGLEAQTSGDVHIGNRSVNGVRASDRDLAMVFQSYALYPHLSVRENMRTPLKLRDLSFWQRFPMVGRFVPGAASALRSMDNAVAETAEILKIEALLDRKPGQLSGGQRQRAALGRAMVRRPVAFLMDEPLSNLDAALRVHMRAELTELHRNLQTTFIYVTHDQAEALTMSTRVAVMMDGDLLQLDTPTKVYSDPQSLQVAEFIGSPKINVLPGTVGSDGTVSVLGFNLHRRLAIGAPNSVKVAVRPEHLSLITDREEAAFVGTVRHIEHLGSDVYVQAVLSDQETLITVRSDPDHALDLSIGSPILIAEARGAAMIFRETGERLRFREDASPAQLTADRSVA